MPIFAGGNVYFDTSKLENTYIFNEQNEEDLAVGVREGVEETPISAIKMTLCFVHQI